MIIDIPRNLLLEIHGYNNVYKRFISKYPNLEISKKLREFIDFYDPSFGGYKTNGHEIYYLLDCLSTESLKNSTATVTISHELSQGFGELLRRHEICLSLYIKERENLYKENKLDEF